MKRKVISIFIICFVIFFFSCKKKKNATTTNGKIETQKTTIKDSLTLLYKTSNFDNTEEFRITAYELSEDSKSLLSGEKKFYFNF